MRRVVGGETAPIPRAESVARARLGSHTCWVSHSVPSIVREQDLRISGTVQDIFDFRLAYFTSPPCVGPTTDPVTGAYVEPCFRGADVNGTASVTVQDVFDFLASWFTCQ